MKTPLARGVIEVEALARGEREATEADRPCPNEAVHTDSTEPTKDGFAS